MPVKGAGARTDQPLRQAQKYSAKKTETNTSPATADQSSAKPMTALSKQSPLHDHDQFSQPDPRRDTTEVSAGRPALQRALGSTLSSHGLVGILQSNRQKSGSPEARFFASVRGLPNAQQGIETYQQLLAVRGGKAHNKLPEAAAAILARDVARGGRQNGLQQKTALDFAKFLTERPRSDFRSFAPNMAQGVSTYVALNHLRRQNPQRLDGPIITSLTLGVLRRRGPAKVGEEGLLTRSQALRAADTLLRTSAKNFNKFNYLLSRTGPTGQHKGSDGETERALLLKALGARREQLTGGNAFFKNMPHRFPAELSIYAHSIRGQKRSTLIRQSTLTDIDGDHKAEAMQQRFTTTCVPTTAEIAAAEVDPVLALRLHQDGAIHSLDAHGLAARDQAETLVGTQRWRLFSGAHWAEPRIPQQAAQTYAKLSNKNASATGLTDGEYRNVLNHKVSPFTGHRFADLQISNNSQARRLAMNKIEAELNAGRDVPIAIQWTDPSGQHVTGGHALLLSDVRRGKHGREFLQTDPWEGTTRWISERDFISAAGGGKNWRLKTIFVAQ